MSPESDTEYLFSYGTLQREEVQLATFGRRLEGGQDVLAGYRLKMIEIQDRDFVAASGAAQHCNLEFTGLESDFVEGAVFKVSRAELELADAYEPDGYKRVVVRLKSGTSAWVYVSGYQLEYSAK